MSDDYCVMLPWTTAPRINEKACQCELGRMIGGCTHMMTGEDLVCDDCRKNHAAWIPRYERRPPPR